MNQLKIIFSIIGTLIGAGFASGQEVNAFFFLYGIKGLIGIFISSVLIGVIIYKTLVIIKTNSISNYQEFLKCIIKNEKLEKYSSYILFFFILISFYVMVAGFGAYLNQEYEFNKILGSSVLAVICFLSFFLNINGILKINNILIPILIIIIFYIR